jgi:hypothetical protein
MYSTGLPPLVPRARAAAGARARAAASFGAWPRHARHQTPDQRPTAFGSDAMVSRERFLELLAASARDAVLAQLRPPRAPAWLATAAPESEELL